MKNLKHTIIYGLSLLITGIFSSCEDTDYPTFDIKQASIYFEKDSIVYSFGTTPLSISNYTLNLPVKIMGIPSKEKRIFKVELIKKKTNAIAEQQYRIPKELVIEADSVNGVIPVKIIRAGLGEEKKWQIGFKLIATTDFLPASEIGDQVVAGFNNIVEPPTWKDWQGNPAWPLDRLGEWNPVVWVKFMEYFRNMEQTSPSTYKKMVEQHGPNLENVNYSWPWDYDYAITKYILIPMYDFFQKHPEYGINMPDPNI